MTLHHLTYFFKFILAPDEVLPALSSSADSLLVFLSQPVDLLLLSANLNLPTNRPPKT